MDIPWDKVGNVCCPFVPFAQFCNEVRSVCTLLDCVDELAPHSLFVNANGGYAVRIVRCV